MRSIGWITMSGKALRLPADESPSGGSGTPSPTPARKGLAALTAKTTTGRREKLAMDIDVTKDSKGRDVLNFSCLVEDFVNNAADTKSGKMAGVFLSQAGQFSAVLKDAETGAATNYTFDLAHIQGGGTFIVTRVISAEPVVTPAAKTAGSK